MLQRQCGFLRNVLYKVFDIVKCKPLNYSQSLKSRFKNWCEVFLTSKKTVVNTKCSINTFGSGTVSKCFPSASALGAMIKTKKDSKTLYLTCLFMRAKNSLIP